MMKMDPMMEALKKRRGKGLELTITVEPNSDEMQEKQSDLAPKPKMDDMSQMQDMDDMDEESDESEVMDEALMEGVSDYDKQDMMSGRKPKSLGERVRMEAMKKKMKS